MLQTVLPCSRGEMAAMTAGAAPARRRFTADDQLRFASVSGDHNPTHLDPVLARRTLAGVPVVHGMHLLLWALDELAAASPGLPPLQQLKARFPRFARVGDEVKLAVSQPAGGPAWLSVNAAGLGVASIDVAFGSPLPRAAFHGLDAEAVGDAVPVPPRPLELTMADMAGLRGRIGFATHPDAVATLFPAAAHWLGAGRVAALAATTLLVGMVCPGLHSLYGGLELTVCDEPEPRLDLRFKVIETDPKFPLIRLAVSGGGLAGRIDSFARPPPEAQPTMRALAGLVGAAEFVGSHVLVIGGSRGLGELTAKLLASGGANVAITYRLGRADAEAVAAEIRDAGGRCEVLPFDTAHAPEPQLQALAEAPTHAYYFATPHISQPAAALFDPARHAQFFDTYVTGFLKLAQALRVRQRAVSLFYPSSEFVEKRPNGMLEYAMAKAAGEQLCTELNLAWAPLRVMVHRLPRLHTDQTATLSRVPAGRALDYLLPAVRSIQRLGLRTC
jgi:NAD(P)-dependent dehydrogenase (short-subunit alcohol dehydrogenase family)